MLNFLIEFHDNNFFLTFDFFPFLWLDRLRRILYRLIGLILRISTSEKSFVYACLCFEVEGGDLTSS